MAKLVKQSLVVTMATCYVASLSGLCFWPLKKATTYVFSGNLTAPLQNSKALTSLHCTLLPSQFLQAVRPHKSAPLSNLGSVPICIGFCAFQDAKEAALEGTDDKVGTADKSNTVEVTAPSDSPSAKPEEVAEGEEPPAVKAQANASPPSKDASLPSDAPPEVGEGENPDAVGQEAGTLDESDTVEVSLSPALLSATHAFRK